MKFLSTEQHRNEKPRSLYGSTVLLIWLVLYELGNSWRFVPCLQCNPSKNRAFSRTKSEWKYLFSFEPSTRHPSPIPRGKRGVINRKRNNLTLYAQTQGKRIKRPGWKLSTFYSHLCRARRRRTCSFAAAAGAFGFHHGERRFALPHASDQPCNLSFRPQDARFVRVANRQADPVQ